MRALTSGSGAGSQRWRSATGSRGSGSPRPGPESRVATWRRPWCGCPRRSPGPGPTSVTLAASSGCSPTGTAECCWELGRLLRWPASGSTRRRSRSGPSSQSTFCWMAWRSFRPTPRPCWSASSGSRCRPARACVPGRRRTRACRAVDGEPQQGGHGVVPQRRVGVDVLDRAAGVDRSGGHLVDDVGGLAGGAPVDRALLAPQAQPTAAVAHTARRGGVGPDQELLDRLFVGGQEAPLEPGRAQPASRDPFHGLGDELLLLPPFVVLDRPLGLVPDAGGRQRSGVGDEGAHDLSVEVVGQLLDERRDRVLMAAHHDQLDALLLHEMIQGPGHVPVVALGQLLGLAMDAVLLVALGEVGLAERPAVLPPPGLQYAQVELEQPAAL